MEGRLPLGVLEDHQGLRHRVLVRAAVLGLHGGGEARLVRDRLGPLLGGGLQQVGGDLLESQGRGEVKWGPLVVVAVERAGPVRHQEGAAAQGKGLEAGEGALGDGHVDRPGPLAGQHLGPGLQQQLDALQVPCKPWAAGHTGSRRRPTVSEGGPDGDVPWRMAT